MPMKVRLKAGRKKHYPHRRARAHFNRTDKVCETAVRRYSKSVVVEQLDELEQR